MTPWTVARQAPLSMEFSRQEFCSGFPFPPPGDLPNPGVESSPPVSSALYLYLYFYTIFSIIFKLILWCACASVLCYVLPFVTPRLWSPRLLCPWSFLGTNTGVGCHFLLLGIFPTQGSNPCLLPWYVGSLPLSQLENPNFIELVQFKDC